MKHFFEENELELSDKKNFRFYHEKAKEIIGGNYTEEKFREAFFLACLTECDNKIPSFNIKKASFIPQQHNIHLSRNPDECYVIVGNKLPVKRERNENFPKENVSKKIKRENITSNNKIFKVAGIHLVWRIGIFLALLCFVFFFLLYFFIY